MRRQLLLLRGLAILAVVANHATAWGFIAMFWWTHRYAPGSVVPDYSAMGGAAYWLLMALNQAALFSVPAFLFISGMSAAYGVGSGSLESDWRVMRARLGALIGPYLLWSLVVFGIDATLGVVLTPVEYALRLLEGRATDAYYFVPLLVQFYVLSPLIVRGVRARPRLLLGLAAAIQVLTSALPYILTALDLPLETRQALQLPAASFVQWSLYYVLGVLLGTHSRRMVRSLSRYRSTLLACSVALAFLMLVESQVLWQWSADWDWAHGPGRIPATLFSLAFLLYAMTWPVPTSNLARTIERGGTLSYGIYLIHPKALEIGARAIYHLAPGLLARQVPLALLLFAMTLTGCWLVMALVARSPARRVYHLVFG